MAKKKKKWVDLPKEEKERIRKLADSLYISPMFVEAMYNNEQIS